MEKLEGAADSEDRTSCACLSVTTMASWSVDVMEKACEEIIAEMNGRIKKIKLSLVNRFFEGQESADQNANKILFAAYHLAPENILEEHSSSNIVTDLSTMDAPDIVLDDAIEVEEEFHQDFLRLKLIEGGSLLGVPFVDPLAGIVVSGMIFKAGIETGYQSAMELVDAGAPLTVLAPIRQTITQVEGVKGCHRLRGRQAGSFLYLDVHIEVDPFLSVSAAHDIGENVRQLIQKSHSQVAEVFIHIDPSYSHCSMSDPRMTSKNLENQNANISKQQEAEAVVSHVISSLFEEKMTVEHITLHKFGGNVLLQVQVSIAPEMMIQDAINMAREAEREILKAASNINQVSILLRLGHPIQGAI